MLQAQVSTLVNGDMSQAVIVSNGIDVRNAIVGSIQAVWTGSPVGDFTVEISNDIVAVGLTNPSQFVTNWVFYTGSTQAAGGGSGNWIWDIGEIGYRWIRLKYTKTSGTGTVNVTWCGKGE